MKEKFLFLIFVSMLAGGCGYSGSGSQDDPVKAKPLIVQSEDGSRYKCQGIVNHTYGGNNVVSVFDCQKIPD